VGWGGNLDWTQTIATRMGLMMEMTTELDVISVKKVVAAMMRSTITVTGRYWRNKSCSPMSFDRPDTWQQQQQQHHSDGEVLEEQELFSYEL